MTVGQERERLRIKRHGEQMRLAREMFNTHMICPDCYAPKPQCKHDMPYDRRKKA